MDNPIFKEAYLKDLRKILLDIIDALEIEKQEGAIEKVKEWNDIKYFTVPNVVGMDIKEATKVLYPVEIEVSGTGNKIVEQSPKEGEKIDITSKIRILLGE